MPRYDYECSQCGDIDEKERGMNNRPVFYCRHCGGEMFQIFSAPHFRFVGGGFYETDYAKPERKEKEARKKNGKT